MSKNSKLSRGGKYAHRVKVSDTTHQALKVMAAEKMDPMSVCLDGIIGNLMARRYHDEMSRYAKMRKKR